MLFLDKEITLQETRDFSLLLEEANSLLENQITFTHEWDMERCNKPYTFHGDWDVNPFGDPEWTWMLNRCRFIETLGLAYYITKNKKYATKAQEFIKDWIVKNSTTKNTQTTWRSIDTGIRITHWIRGLEYITETCSQDFLDLVKKSLYEQGKYLVENISNTSYTSNWGVLEFYGVLCLSLLGEFSEAEEWKDLSLEVLYKTSQCQIFDDGSQWERSPMYHNEVLFCYLHTIFLTQKFNIPLSDNFRQKVEKMVYANLYWQKPNGNQIMLGDSDDTNLCQLLSVAASILGNGDFKQVKNLDIEYYFYLSTLYEAVPENTFEVSSHYFKNMGLLILRNNHSSSSDCLSFVTKNFGGGHSHSDLLHIGYYVKESDYLIDCGRLTYTECPERAYLKSAQAHNSITINNVDKTIYKDSWSTTKEANYLTGDWHTHDQFDWAFAHDISYLNSSTCVTRNIINFGGNGFLILDAIQCHTPISFQLIFNTPKETTVSGNIAILEDLILRSQLRNTLAEGIYSKHYNEKSTCQQIIQSGNTEKNIIIPNLFTFDKNSSLEIFQLNDRKNRNVSSDKGQGIKVRIGNEEYTILYKIAPSAEHSGFFIQWDNQFYLNNYILFHNGNKIFDF